MCRQNQLNRHLAVRNLGVDVPYREALALQEELHSQRVRGVIPDTLLLLEHRSVYTLGRTAHADNVLLPLETLQGGNIELVETNRGGDVTYHGPGQLVGYPIIHLGDASLRVVEYIETLEECLLRVAQHFGVQAGRDRRNRGVWVGNCKLAAIGVRISRQVAMHGFALNIAPDLKAYQNIVPCGLVDAGVTSLAALLARPPSVDQVIEHLTEIFRTTFGYSSCRSDAQAPAPPLPSGRS